MTFQEVTIHIMIGVPEIGVIGEEMGDFDEFRIVSLDMLQVEF